MSGLLLPGLESFDREIRRSARISTDGQFRWTLTRTWGDGPQVCFIGLNPSTADHRVDDPTVRRWMHFARAWGYDGFTAVNLYPFRSSSPAECRKWADWEKHGPDWYTRDAIYFQNGPIVVETAKKAGLVVACWGCGNWDDAWAEQIAEDITSGEEPWPHIFCFGETAAGHPIHPMARGKHRISDDAQYEIWRLGNP